MSVVLNDIYTFVNEYSENFVLISVLVLTYFMINIFRKETPEPIKLTKQKIAEEYLKQHENDDDEFFFHDLIEN